MKSQFLRKQLITVTVDPFHQAIDRSWEEPFNNHLITDILVESFSYTWSNKGKMFGLYSPLPPSKAVEYLDVSTCEVAVCKSHQAKTVTTKSVSSLCLFLFWVCMLKNVTLWCKLRKVFYFSLILYRSSGTSMHAICTSVQSCFLKPFVHVEADR